MRLEIFDRRSELLYMLAEAEEMERFRLKTIGRVQSNFSDLAFQR